MARAASRKTKSPMSGRAIVALSLIGLVSIAALVVWRRTIAVAENRVVRTLEARKRELISIRTTLEHDITDASSRSHIVPAAERRLGMHVATELEVRNLPVQGVRGPAAADTTAADSTFARNAGSTGLVAARATARRTP